MPDFSKTIIYKIQHEDDESLLYVGSTTNFTKRKCSHKRNCNNPNGKEFNTKIYQMIRDNGGWNGFKMIQIKEFPCNNRREAEAEEDRIMMELKANMNHNRASRSHAEWYIDNREKILEQFKQYYNVNSDKIIEKNKQNYIDNRDKIVEQKKKYYNENRDKFIEQKKQYYTDNRDKILETQKQKMTCECGCIFNKGYLSKHRKTKKHIDLLKGSK